MSGTVKILRAIVLYAAPELHFYRFNQTPNEITSKLLIAKTTQLFQNSLSAIFSMSSEAWTKSEVFMNGTISISMYRSTRSQLLVAIGDVPVPVVKGCITFGKYLFLNQSSLRNAVKMNKQEFQ